MRRLYFCGDLKLNWQYLDQFLRDIWVSHLAAFPAHCDHSSPPTLHLSPSLTIPDYVVLHLMSHASITLAKLSRILFFVCFVYTEIVLALGSSDAFIDSKQIIFLNIHLLILNVCRSHQQFDDYSHRGSVNPSEQSMSRLLLNMSLVNTSHRSQVQLPHYHHDCKLYCKERGHQCRSKVLIISAMISPSTAYHEGEGIYPPEYGPYPGVPPHIYHQLERHPRCSWQSYPEAINSKCELSLDCSTKQVSYDIML